MLRLVAFCVLVICIVAPVNGGTVVRDEAFWAKLIRALAPRPRSDIVLHVSRGMNGMIERYNLNNNNRIAHFLAQLLHESAWFRTTVEFADGSAYNPPGRKATNLGNTQRGDGPRFKGRGLIQLTGRENYRTFGRMMGVDFISNPELPASFPYALEVAGLYWTNRKINNFADGNDVTSVTKKVNGGRNHLAERIQAFNKVLRELNSVSSVPGPVSPAEPRLSIDWNEVNNAVIRLPDDPVTGGEVWSDSVSFSDANGVRHFVAPSPAARAAIAAAAPPPRMDVPPPLVGAASSGPRQHTVVSGDTYYSLARTYYGTANLNASVQRLQRANGNRALSVGGRITIP